MARLVAICTVLAVLAVVVLVMAPPLASTRAPAGPSGAEQKCDIGKLINCGPAIIGGTTPSESCCSNLKAQDESCFCQYAKDPAYSQYINSPNVPKTFTSCGITLPTCPK